jgi:hypothetical protein
MSIKGPIVAGLSFGASFLVGALLADIINPLPFIFQNGTIADATQVNADFAQILANVNANAVPVAAGNLVPAKAVMAFNLSACPVGWKLADGSAGTVDLRGNFIRGWSPGGSGDPGRVLGSFQGDQLQDHQHNYNNPGGSLSYQGGGFFAFNFSATTPTSNPITGNHGTETRPVNRALLYCQKT